MRFHRSHETHPCFFSKRRPFFDIVMSFTVATVGLGPVFETVCQASCGMPMAYIHGVGNNLRFDWLDAYPDH